MNNGGRKKKIAKAAAARFPRPEAPATWEALAGELGEAMLRQDHMANIYESCGLPGRHAVAGLVDGFLAALFPGIFGDTAVSENRLKGYLCQILEELGQTLERFLVMCLEFHPGGDGTSRRESGAGAERKAKAVVPELFKALPWIRGVLSQDLLAAYEGDPAAGSVLEVLMSYPCVEAIATHRVAHELYRMKAPILPRMMSEVAHSRTGIDIHPGASIGPGFFIDHGTGVVIGETTVIGRGVKLYQGVTLGALSFPKDKDGQLIKGIKRHPNIEDGVTIYAGATVLGGQTTIGKGSTIGGNCWITSSVPPDSLVLAEQVRHEKK